MGRARISEEGDARDQDAEARKIRGSGNVYLDLGQDDADVKQLKALLAAEIIKTLDRDKLTVRAAHARTGIAAADFSRIRNADPARSPSIAWSGSLIGLDRVLKSN